MALAINRRFSLSAVSEGWDECYVLYRPATYDEIIQFEDLDKENPTGKQNIDKMHKFIKGHFRSGKVLKDGENGADLVEMTDGDIHELPRDVIDELVLAIIGGKIDPKDDAPTAR